MALVLAVLVPSLLTPDLASASGHRAAPDPTPQAAPSAPAGSTPAPDPAPQAAVRSHPVVRSQSSRSSPVLITSRRVPTVTAPRIVHVAAPAQRPTAASSDVTHVSPLRPSPGKPRHRAAVSRTPAHHARPVAANHISLSFPLGFLEKHLLRLAPGAFRGADAPQRDGVLLLLASLAMGVLAVSSFALSRRLKGLE